jgi:transcriptional regulator with XRE-family HTH domain
MNRVLKSAEMWQFDQALGNQIVKARKLAGMRCKELSAAAGISPSGLYSYEAGRTSCPPFMLSRLAHALQISITALIPNPTSCSFPTTESHEGEKSC